MPLTERQMQLLDNNIVTRSLITAVFGNDEYYLKPLVFIEDELNLKLNCNGQTYRLAVECAHDEDIAPEWADTKVIADGVLAYVYCEQLEACGLDLTTYFTYRFSPPSPEFQERLNQFETMMKEAV